MSQLTSISVDTQKRFLPFLNVSEKRIPPFGAMQIVGNPKSYQDALKDPSLDEVGKSFAKISNLGGVGQFDRGVQLYCDQIGLAGEFLQNPAFIAFNSDSSVDPGGSGRCFLAEYPVRGLCLQHPSWYCSYAVRRGCWHLSCITGNYGAFRSSFRTGQGVGIEVQDASGQTQRKVTAMVLGLIPLQRDPWVPSIEAQWSVDGQGIFPISSTRYNSVASSFTQDPIFDDVAFAQADTLTLRLPGTYMIYLEGVLRVKQSIPSEALRVPYRIGVVPHSRADLPMLDFNSYTPMPLAILRCHRETPLDAWYQISSMPPSGELLWSRHRYSSMLQVKVLSAPAKISIAQDQSPFIESIGTSKLLSAYLTDWQLNRLGLGMWGSSWGSHLDYPWYGNYSSFGLAGNPVLEFDPGSPFKQTWTLGLAFNDISDGIVEI